MTTTQRNEILRAYRIGLAEALGEALDSVILYGSHARGEERNDSDIDVLCVMRRAFDYGELISRTSELTAQLSLEHGIVLSRAFVTRDDYESRQLPFLMNVRKEGIPV
ncbi:MAG: nucleotidyltransferase domain-containing protein [Candidatus Hydrogenedentes bacterium]|nr:nucleotidyltransferase domain-containing protein [Candidatus Hydrogenedentota bacterium]